ncbi:DUF1127 domain-containing protein [Amphritea sp. HPY]|uniref:DUF1127 domain-containing protein n=1 Tax=Amphritea sp. HPY TaxID=3421652 RepID=UPI003D7E39FB
MRVFSGSLVNKFRGMAFNYRSRRQLLTLDNRALKDIGISRAEALAEAGKPAWKGLPGYDVDELAPAPVTDCRDSVTAVSAKRIAGCSVFSLILVTVLVSLY